MVILKNDELSEIYGGASTFSIGAILGGIFVIVAGIIDGFIRPIKCD